MKLIHHFLYYLSVAGIYAILFIGEIQIFLPLLNYVIPESWFWTAYLVMGLLMIFPNPLLTWILADRVSRFLVSDQ